MKRGRKAKCIFCGANRTIAKGVRRTATLGVRRLRVCKACGRKFTVGRTDFMPAVPVPTVTAVAARPGVMHTVPGIAADSSAPGG